MIVCTLTGAILGDIQTGLITGGLTELAFAGLTPCRWCSAAQPYYGGSDDHRHCMVYGR
ncbi:PTS sugar transporter subunit IIC [Escherichia coli]|nr:PTS sugar transporter subunit IIC [Escherichia coli]